MDGKSGIFPSSFVKIVDAFPGDMPADTTSKMAYLNAQYHQVISTADFGADTNSTADLIVTYSSISADY